MENILLLASKSKSRETLLIEADIQFILAQQDADETKCDWELPLPELVENIANYKMEHVILPEGKEDQEIFVFESNISLY